MVKDISDISILIIDDDVLVAAHLQKILSSMGYVVAGIFASGEEAVEEAGRLKPDVMIMDIQLRDEMNGIEAARIIHEKFEIPIIFITAFSDDELIAQACLTGPYGYLTKPVKERELRANIEMALYKSGMDKQVKNLSEVIYAIREVDHVINRERNIQNILDESSRILITKRNYQMVWMGILNPDRQSFSNTAFSGKVGEGQDLVTRYVSDSRAWPIFFTEVLNSGLSRILQKSVQTPEPGEWKMSIDQLDVKSLCAVPLGHGAAIFGLIWVFARDEDAFTTDETELLKELADDIGFSVQSIREEEKRRQAETALRQTEERARLIIEQTGQILYDYDIPTGCIVWEGAAEEVAAMEKKEGNVTDISFWESCIHPEDHDQAMLALEKSIREHVPYYSEYRFRRKDGSYYYVEATGVILPSNFGEGYRLLGLMKNITEKKMTLEALRKSEERFRQLFMEAPLPYHSLDRKGVLLDVNKTWLDLLGYERSEVIGVPLEHFLHPNSVPVFQKVFSKFVEKGEAITVLEVYKKNGELLTIEFKGRIGYTLTGEFKQTHSILNDITEQVQIEKELIAYKEHLQQLVLERTARLNTSVSLLNATLESTPDGILVTSPEGDISKLNNRFLEMFNLSGEQMLQGSFSFFLEQITPLLPAEDTLKALKEMAKRSVSGNKIEFSLNDEKTYECYTFPQMQGRKIVGTVWTFSDITERKKIEKELIEARMQAEMASRAKSEFLANMSHEIRTPMNAVIGFSDLLDRKIEQPDLKNYVRSIKSSGQALLHIINDVLDISKIEAGHMEIHMEPTRLQTVFSEIESIFSMKIAQKMLKFKLEIPKDFPFAINIDALRLQQILMNLVGNAIKFTDKGSIGIKASFKHKGPDFISLRIDVKDTGIGIDPENQKEIFEAFIQPGKQDQKKYGGTGLGLYISRLFVELMGGTIKVAGKPGAGSTFSLIFKNIQIYEKDLEKPHEQAGIDYDALWFDNQVVLIVDDVETNRNLVKSMLCDCNLVLLEAHNGFEAVKMAKIYKPDLIFMDLRMPVMDGYEATQKIKADPEIKRTAIIAITASAAETNTDTNPALGLFDGYLRKPVMMPDIKGEMIKFLDFAEKKPETIGESGAKKKSANQTYSLRKRADLELFIRNKILPLWEQLNRDLLVPEAENLARLLIRAGDEFNVEALNLLGEELMSHIKTIDRAKIKAQLAKLPAILEENSLLNS